MKQYTDEQVLGEYKNLPEDLKKAIFSVEMTEVIKRIGEKYQLHIDKIGALGNETGMVMFGVTRPKDFISNLSQRLEVPTDVARNIAGEINQQIFAKVRESLKKIHGIEEVPMPEEVEAPTPKDVGKEKKETIQEIEKKEVLKEIEHEEKEEKMPEIMKGARIPENPTTPFEAKTKEEIFRMPAQESERQYPQGDPYREPVE